MEDTQFWTMIYSRAIMKTQTWAKWCLVLIISVHMGITSMVSVMMMELITTTFMMVMIMTTTWWSLPLDKKLLWIWSYDIQHHDGTPMARFNQRNRIKGHKTPWKHWNKRNAKNKKLEHREIHWTMMSLCFKKYSCSTRATVHPSNKKVTSSASFVSVISCSRWETSSTSGICEKNTCCFVPFWSGVSTLHRTKLADTIGFHQKKWKNTEISRQSSIANTFWEPTFWGNTTYIMTFQMECETHALLTCRYINM